MNPDHKTQFGAIAGLALAANDAMARAAAMAQEIDVEYARIIKILGELNELCIVLGRGREDETDRP